MKTPEPFPLLNSAFERGLVPLGRQPAPGVSHLSLYDPSFAEMAGVLSGVKPVAYTGVFIRRLPELALLCRRLGLSLIPAERAAGSRCKHVLGGQEVFFIGRDKSLLCRAARLWRKPGENESWAGLLGYPACCVKAFSGWLRRNNEGPDLVEAAFEEAGGPRRIDFRLNNVCNFASRVLHHFPEDGRGFGEMTMLNRDYVFNSLHVISWHPCSYSCRESLKKAEAVFSCMDWLSPRFAAAVKAALSRPVLFWGKFRFAFLDARRAAGGFSGASAGLPLSPLPPGVRRLLAPGFSVRRSGRRAALYRGAKRLAPPGGDPLLLDFR